MQPMWSHREQLAYSSFFPFRYGSKSDHTRSTVTVSTGLARRLLSVARLWEA
jgi:hypothetical protein